MLKEIKRSLFIFPEGTRSADGNIQEFKGGGAILALRSNVPIVPVIIHGSRAIMPKNSKKIKSSKVIVEIKKPVYIDELGIKNKAEIMSVIRDIICESFDKGKRKYSNA
jgi:1-acyl-sn-glycerol-3-phosphate acyltransferase